MVTGQLKSELTEILNHIENKNNFLLSGGAGSGKTYTLVAVINSILKNNPLAKIACITYTNAAVREIQERVSGANANLTVSTIHEFLWKNISHFQSELRETLITSVNDENIDIKYHGEVPISHDFYDEIDITYQEYLKITDGVVSHDEVIILAHQMYKKYIKLCNILKDKYDFIFVDEYQDTSPLVVEILLCFLANSKKENIIGFFGDAMQSIYDDGVGDIYNYLKYDCIHEVIKNQNRRNPQNVIELANKIRTDAEETPLLQEPSEDLNAPNMLNGTIKKGTISFIYGEDCNLENLKKHTIFNEWDFTNATKTKELRLTHNLIADEAKFDKLLDIYANDPVLKLKTDFFKYISECDIEIDMSCKFEEAMRNVQWIRSKARDKTLNGRHHLDIFLDNEENKKIFELVKSKTCAEVKKIFFSKDSMLADKSEQDEKNTRPSKRDFLIRHLYKISSIIYDYEHNNFNEFIKKTSFKIQISEDKLKIKKEIEHMKSIRDNKSIFYLIECAHNSGLCIKDDRLNSFISSNDYLYKRVCELKFEEFEFLYQYLEGYSALSTQHKVKGAEFDNVLVILDNGKWSNYNFNYLFNKNHPRINKNVLKRTQKLFYVCCTRAKENLVVFCNNPSPEMLATAHEWFGASNCIKLNGGTF